MPYVTDEWGGQLWQPDLSQGGSEFGFGDQPLSAEQRAYQNNLGAFNYYGNPTGFENLWGAYGGHGIDLPSNFGFNNFDYLNQTYGDLANQSLFNASPENQFMNDYAQYVVRPDLPHVGRGGTFYQTDASKMYNWFAKNAPEGLKDPQVWNYLNAMDQATRSAAGHTSAYRQANAKRSKQTTAASLAAVLGPAGAAGGLLAGAAIGGLSGYGLSGGDWRGGLKGAVLGGLGPAVGGLASQAVGGGLAGQVLGGVASGAAKQLAGRALDFGRPATTGGAVTAPSTAGASSQLAQDVVGTPTAETITQQTAASPTMSPLAQAVTSSENLTTPATTGGRPRIIRLAPGFRRGY